MEHIDISTLRVGQVFDRSIFSLNGQKLLNAGVPLKLEHLHAFRAIGDKEVLLAASLEELVSAGIISRLDGSALKVGQTAREGVMTAGGQMLLDPNDEIEPHHLDALAAGGGALVSKTQAQLQWRERILMGDALVKALEEQIPSLKLRVMPEANSDWIKPVDSKDWPEVEQLTHWRNDQVEKLRDYYARIEAGLPIPLDRFNALVDDLQVHLAQHPTRFTQLALLCQRREDYLPDHAYTVTVLAMGIATRLGWPLHDVRQMGLAGLLFDLGMLLIAQRIRTSAAELSESDRGRVQRHPIFSLAMLQMVEGVPPIIQLAALQHHERENGTGYPCGTRRDAVCDYAKVLAVADSFAATTEPRHYRKPKLPYIAMEETLYVSTTSMAFWKPARCAGCCKRRGIFPWGRSSSFPTARTPT